MNFSLSIGALVATCWVGLCPPAVAGDPCAPPCPAPCAAPSPPACVCKELPARCETRQRVVVCPAVTREVSVPCHETVECPVYETRRTPQFTEVEVPVFACRDVPCQEPIPVASLLRPAILSLRRACSPVSPSTGQEPASGASRLRLPASHRSRRARDGHYWDRL